MLDRNTEVYHFYVCYDNDPVSFCDLISGEAIPSGATVENGFTLFKNGSSNSFEVTVNNKPVSISDEIACPTAEGPAIKVSKISSPS